MPLSWALLKAAATDGRLSCSDAFSICERQMASPAQVGEAADSLGVRITRCQLGLFGWRDEPPVATAEGPAAMAEAVERWRERGLPCAEAWRLAASLGVARLAVGRAADTAGVKVTACQLGCF